MQTMWSTQDIYKTIFFKLDLKLGSLLFLGGNLLMTEITKQPPSAGASSEGLCGGAGPAALGPGASRSSARSLWPLWPWHGL